MANRKEKSKELEKRTKQFAVMIIQLAGKLPDKEAGKVMKYQMIKAGTSVGANYREANRSVSKADFRNKISICMKEASETQYWLEVAVEAEMLSWIDVKQVYEECSELLAIFTASYSTSKKSQIS
ncbi:MAG: four helix bundle protein [Halobacteriota archaeon]